MAKTKNTKATQTRVGGKTVETIQHTGATRKNIPSAEHQSVLEKTEAAPRPVKYPRNTDLDPQLVWRGKDELDWTDLVVQAPPLYIQERVHPKVLVDDLLRQSKQMQGLAPGAQVDLFGDFNGIPEGVDRTEFYRHNQNWSNRMILGDSLQVMASLAEREGLRGKVQCIYIDPPYGIKFNSNFQWSTTSRDVKDGNAGHISREPEQVKAFRDTWRDGIHSYLTHLRDRLTIARDLLTERRVYFCADRGRECPSSAGVDGRGVWRRQFLLNHPSAEDREPSRHSISEHCRLSSLVLKVETRSQVPANLQREGRRTSVLRSI